MALGQETLKNNGQKVSRQTLDCGINPKDRTSLDFVFTDELSSLPKGAKK